MGTNEDTTDTIDWNANDIVEPPNDPCAAYPWTNLHEREIDRCVILGTFTLHLDY